MILQIGVLHSYDEVKMVFLGDEQSLQALNFIRYLPHFWNDSRTMRFIALNSADACQISEYLKTGRAADKEQRKSLKDILKERPYYVIFALHKRVYDSAEVLKDILANENSTGVSVVAAFGDLPKECTKIIQMNAAGSHQIISLKQLDGENQEFRLDAYDPELAVMAEKKLAATRLKTISENFTLPKTYTVLEMFGVGKVEHLNVLKRWQDNNPTLSLAAPVGIGTDGLPFTLDLHQKYQGPHGLVAGTSGSGKSEMAQTWIISMALQFSPEDVNFILVDFKGTSLLTPFRNLPHLAGSISNLDRDIRRSLLSIDSEMERRQRLLDHYGISDINGYLARRRKDPSMEPMPHLMLVFDEFAEFKTQFPEFSSVLDHVFRGGRSLGVHSVLMTQKPSGVVTDQMKANANFSWCLKVQTEADSREVLGTGDAAYIRNPGRSYVKCGDGTYQLIQSYYAGAPYLPGGPGRQAQVSAVSLSGRRRPVKGTGNRQGSGMTQLEALTACIADYCRRKNIPPARRIWTEKLPEKKELFDLTGGPWKEWREEEPGAVQAVLGLVDDPARQRQEILSHDFWEKGHLLLYGMPLSGRTTFLQTMLISLACRYTPAQVQFYMLEFNGYGLRAMETFPHVGAAAGSDEPEELRQIAGLLEKELDRRKKAFRRLGAGSISAYLEAGGTEAPTWVVLADNLNLARESFPDIYACMVRISREGAACGIYLACSILGTESGSYQLSPNIKTVLTLQQPDRLDAAVCGHLLTVGWNPIK